MSPSRKLEFSFVALAILALLSSPVFADSSTIQPTFSEVGTDYSTTVMSTVDGTSNGTNTGGKPLLAETSSIVSLSIVGVYWVVALPACIFVYLKMVKSSSRPGDNEEGIKGKKKKGADEDE